MRSSYLSNLNFGDILNIVVKMVNPKKIVEFGLLDGFSLKKFADSSDKNCIIEGNDIFDDFVGNHGDENKVKDLFKEYDNVIIKKANFYDCVELYDNDSIDIIHIDIANDGDVYEFAISHYLKKIKKNGIMILEGGSEERDNIDWMNKYNKKKIIPIINKYKNIYNIFTIDKFPSLTIIKK